MGAAMCLAAIMFFAGGYVLSQNLLHLKLPHFGEKPRTTTFDVNKEPPSQLQFSMDSIQNFDPKENIAEHLSKMFAVNNVRRAPTANVEAKKRDVLLPCEPKHNHPPSYDVKKLQGPPQACDFLRMPPVTP
jgi:hypothetical protein